MCSGVEDETICIKDAGLSRGLLFSTEWKSTCSKHEDTWGKYLLQPSCMKQLEGGHRSVGPAAPWYTSVKCCAALAHKQDMQVWHHAVWCSCSLLHPPSKAAVPGWHRWKIAFQLSLQWGGAFRHTAIWLYFFVNTNASVFILPCAGQFGVLLEPPALAFLGDFFFFPRVEVRFGKNEALTCMRVVPFFICLVFKK